MAAKPGARARVKPPPVQILVVVANIQMGTLKTEGEKGSVRTALGHGLVDPEGCLGRRQHRPSASRASAVSAAGPERESGSYSRTGTWILYGDMTEVGDASAGPGKSSLFFLTRAARPGI